MNTTPHPAVGRIGPYRLRDHEFMVIFQPLPIRGLDSSPVNIVAIEGVPGFGPAA